MKICNSLLSQTGYTFYMSVSDGGRVEATHKKLLEPTVEIHDATRLQVNDRLVTTARDLCN